MSQHVYRSNNLLGSAMDPVERVERDVLPMRSAAYGLDDISGFGARNEPILSRDEPILSGLTAGLPRGYSSSIEDPVLISQRRERSVGITPAPPVNPDMIYERPVSQQRVNGLSAPPGDSNILFVDGLPTDCTRREVGHIFRPFIGFKDIKVIHKEPRRSGDKALVLCFVEFDDAKCALTAMEALQGYKFDDKKPNSPVLRIHFAHFPFHLPSEHGDPRFGTQ